MIHDILLEMAGEQKGLQTQELEDAKAKYFAIPINFYQPDEIISRDLYVFYQGQHFLYRPKNLIWNIEDFKRLQEFEVKSLFIRCEDAKEHHQFLETNLSKILDEPKIPGEEKAQILFETSTFVIEDIFSRPSSSENVKRSVGLVKNSLEYLRDRENFFEFMRFASEDFNEYTHAMQVAAYAITLARQCGMKSFNDLSAIGIGSLLHDFGKVKIDKNILNKPGPLTEEERREVQKHPEYGYEILHRQRSIPEMAEVIVLQHHERPQGTGYPYRLGADMMFSAKILSLVDCFDSLTSNRPYKAKMKGIEAIEYMQNEIASDYDQNLMIHFVRMLGRKS